MDENTIAEKPECDNDTEDVKNEENLESKKTSITIVVEPPEDSPSSFEGITEDLREALTTEYRNIRINPLPWLKNTFHSLETHYVAPEFEEVINKEKISVAPNDVIRGFLKTVVIGSMGYGKTMLCHKVAYDWATKNQPHYLSHFTAVILVQLKSIEGKNLADVILDSIMERLKEHAQYTLWDVFRLVKFLGRKLLIILDSLDFLSQNQIGDVDRILNGGDVFSNATLLATRRTILPAAKMTKHFDREIMLRGLGLQATEEYLTSIYREYPQHVPHVIEKLLIKRPCLQDLGKNALLIYMMCYSIASYDPKSKISIAQVYESILKCILQRTCELCQVESLKTKEENDGNSLSVLVPLASFCARKVLIQQFEFDFDEFKDIFGSKAKEFLQLGLFKFCKITRKGEKKHIILRSVHDTLMLFLAVYYVKYFLNLVLNPLNPDFRTMALKNSWLLPFFSGKSIQESKVFAYMLFGLLKSESCTFLDYLQSPVFKPVFYSNYKEISEPVVETIQMISKESCINDDSVLEKLNKTCSNVFYISNNEVLRWDKAVTFLKRMPGVEMVALGCSSYDDMDEAFFKEISKTIKFSPSIHTFLLAYNGEDSGSPCKLLKLLHQNTRIHNVVTLFQRGITDLDEINEEIKIGDGWNMMFHISVKEPLEILSNMKINLNIGGICKKDRKQKITFVEKHGFELANQYYHIQWKLRKICRQENIRSVVSSDGIVTKSVSISEETGKEVIDSIFFKRFVWKWTNAACEICGSMKGTSRGVAEDLFGMLRASGEKCLEEDPCPGKCVCEFSGIRFSAGSNSSSSSLKYLKDGGLWMLIYSLRKDENQEKWDLAILLLKYDQSLECQVDNDLVFSVNSDCVL